MNEFENIINVMYRNILSNFDGALRKINLYINIYFWNWMLFLIMLILLIIVWKEYIIAEKENKKHDKNGNNNGEVEGLEEKNNIYKKYLFINNIIRFIMNSFFIILFGFIIRKINGNDFKILFIKYIPLIYMAIFIVYILSKIFSEKIIGDIEKCFLRAILYITYFAMFAAALFNIKYVLMTFVFGLLVINSMDLKAVKDISDEDDGIKLYEKRENQLKVFNEVLNNILKEDNKIDENYAIALCGEWGSGKSEFLSRYMKIYANENCFIFIKPMVTDSIESLTNQFSKQLTNIMRENSIYFCNNNIKKYFKEVLRLMNLNSKVSLDLSIFEGKDNETYLEYKENIRKDIELFIKKTKKKILVIVDDFDRVDEEKQKIILQFIKDIVDFKGCTTIFAVDYNNLLKNEEITSYYMEKFVDRKIELCEVDFNELIEIHSKKILHESFIKNNEVDEVRKDILKNISKYYKDMEKRFSKWKCSRYKKAKEEKENKNNVIRYTNEVSNYIKQSFKNSKNSRRIINFLNSIKDSLILLDKLYSTSQDKIALLKSINTCEIIYVINYIKIFNEKVYKRVVDDVNILSEENKCMKELDDYDINNSEDKLEILELYYINIIVKNIITRPGISIIYTDYKGKLKRDNEKLFINDIFKNYEFTSNNVELVTEMDKKIEELKVGKSNLEHINIEKFDEEIFRYEEILNDKTMNTCIENYLNTVIDEIEEKKYNMDNFIDIILSDQIGRKIRYADIYLKVTKDLLQSQKIKFTLKDKEALNKQMYWWKHRNLEGFKGIVNRYLFLINKELDINENIFESISKIEQNSNYDIEERTKKVTIELINIIQKQNDINLQCEDLKELTESLRKNLDSMKLEFEEEKDEILKILKEKLDKFIEIDSIIDEIISMNPKNIDEYCEVDYSEVIYRLDENEDTIKKALKMLNEENELDYEMIRCFIRILDIWDNKYKNTSMDSKILDVFRKINRKKVDDYDYLTIAILIERIKSANKMKLDIEKDK